MKNIPCLKLLLATACCLFQTGILFGSDYKPLRQVQAGVYFRIGESEIDPTFENNRQRLEAFTSSLNKILYNSEYEVGKVKVMGTASPDGKEEINVALAGRRAQALGNYILSHTNLSPDKLEIVNGGENWAAMRNMIEASQMPYREEMLRLMDRYPDDRDARKHSMQFYADSKPWLWMYEHFFADLRMGSGGQKSINLTSLSLDNWTQLKELVMQARLPDELKRTLLDIMSHESDPAARINRIRMACPDNIYKLLQSFFVSNLLNSTSTQSIENWELLRTYISASADIPSKHEVLRIIDNVPATMGREKQLQQLGNGAPYRYIIDKFIPLLLGGGQHNTFSEDLAVGSVSSENWRRLRDMISVSDMPDKENVLALIDNTPDAAERERELRKLNGGYSYNYISTVFFPELLYGISSTAQENWQHVTEVVRVSDLPNKAEILKIIQTTAPGTECEEAIRALDGGKSWETLEEMLLPEILQDSKAVAMTGSGMSFYYDLSPKAKARAIQLHKRTPPPMPADTLACPCGARTDPALLRTNRKARRKPKPQWYPVVGFQTDLVLWAGVMPGFELGTYTPNLALEVYFGRRWSVSAGAMFAKWNSFSGSKTLFAVDGYALETRIWYGQTDSFKGFYSGLYGVYGTFDRQKTATGVTGSYYTAGLSCGWVQTLSRHWYIDLGIRVGYNNAWCDHYNIIRDQGRYDFDYKSTVGKFSPAVRIGITYRIGSKGPGSNRP